MLRVHCWTEGQLFAERRIGGRWLPQHDWHPLARRDTLPVRRDYHIAVGTRRARDIARATPATKLDFRVLEFSGKNSWQESLQTGLGFDLGFQPGAKKGQLLRSSPG